MTKADNGPEDHDSGTEPGTGRGAEPGVTVAKAGGRTGVALVVGLCVVAALAFGLYGMVPSSGKRVAHSGACARSLDLAQSVGPLVRGEVAALTLATKPNELGPIAFKGPDGQPTSVAAFKGRTILLNLWATWCVPCRQEMPALDKLQTELGSKDFSVVPINIDTVRLEKAKAFLQQIGATSLPYYADHSADVLQQLKRHEQIVGLPTTILIGKDGCEIGTMAGPANWASPDAKSLIEKLEKPHVTPS